MTHIRPVGNNVPISDDYDEHTRRNPPSTEPGTDYACKKYTPVMATNDGVVVSIKTNVIGAPGRRVIINYIDGTSGDFCHLDSSIYVSRGDRVSKGEVIALSGTSAFGKDWGTDPHLHYSLFLSHNPQPGTTRPVDFEKFFKSQFTGVVVGKENDMPLDANDKEWVRIQTRQEIGGALSGFIKAFADEVEKRNINSEDKAWLRLMVQQEVSAIAKQYQ